MNQFLKYTFRIIICICIAGVALSCSPKTKMTKAPSKTLPPGQAKKVAGAQSAKEFAPGQQKKTTGSQPATKSVPPGQAKKAEGSQSAKEEAPGQQKKKK